MIDFIEYVVGELKSKRLSKRDAVALIEKFSQGSAAPSAARDLHPLVHRNTSDLTRQKFSSSFSGNEFFLRDHRVQGNRVLPAVAYLEMVRAAMAAAQPGAAGTLGLRNVAWAQPIVVSEPHEVELTLCMDDERPAETLIDCEIASTGDDAVHFQCQATFTAELPPQRCDLDSLRARMTQGRLEAAAVYPAIAALGIDIGPSHRAIASIYQGEREQLAHIALPDVVQGTLDDYVLHPSIMDGVLQAASALIVDPTRHSGRAPLPFALESMHVFSGCKGEMYAWARYSAGSQPGDAVAKLDVDVCDADGNVCVRMRGFSSRVAGAEIGELLAAPEWISAVTAPAASPAAPDRHHVLLCNLANVDEHELEAVLGGSSVRVFPLAGRFNEVSLACFEHIREILEDRSAQRVLVQVVVPRDDITLAGVSALLKSAARENPRVIGQVIVTDADTTERLARQLQGAQRQPQEPIVRYERGEPMVCRWRALEKTSPDARSAFKDRGVYVITGGLGGLGVLFAREILAQTSAANVVLTGRSALTPERTEALDKLFGGTARVSYRQMDLGDPDQVRRVLETVKLEHGGLNGILHSAGMIADSFILKKTREEFAGVLAPKVAGTINLDEASRDFDLDFLALFSAGAAVHGNAGQADYAAANGFMDQFAGVRNQRVSAGERRGHTVSINWPLWQEGGMSIDAASLEGLQRETGMYPMRTATGMRAFHECLQLQRDQVLVVEGDLARIQSALLSDPAPTEPVEVVAAAPESTELLERTQNFLRREFAAVLKLPSSKIDAQAPLEKYGIDSIVAMDLTNQLEQSFGSLPKTLFFEYRSVRELAGYLMASQGGKLAALFASSSAPKTPDKLPATVKPVRSRASRGSSVAVRAPAATTPVAVEPIAIVGLSGRYPGSPDIEAFWRNLRDGVDCIVEVPKERWDWREYFTEDRARAGHHYSKWGGFIQGVDEFDPLFFNISPREARIMDPQERLFLQHAWMAVEDAGYTRASLQIPNKHGMAGQVGVYVGVMYGEYNLSGSLAGIANRVSSVMNLHGPSMALDTMCSSSLTAIHLACQDLRQGRTDLAIAGGVNVSIHPSKYLMLSAGQFISSDGHCQSFGEGGDGYIPGEGVGAVLLKRLADAERDGDHIYGIVRGSALNHGGRTNGYTVPNPQAQASAIVQALADANARPQQISYVEAHGTGTKLGDPIEIAALTKAFDGQQQGVCAIGSVKSNIGHCEAAAGIAGVTKVLLQMQHRQIVPSLHSARLNPHIDFENTPFVVNQSLRAWDPVVVDGRPLPRMAGLSSFGAGGSNAHLVIEEYTAPARASQPDAPAQVVIPLSARTPEQLRQRACELLEFILAPERKAATLDLSALAYTLQVGREAMDERVGFVVETLDQLVEKLQAWQQGGQDIEGAAQGQVKTHRDTLSVLNEDPDFQHTVDRWIARGNLAKLLDLWAKGLEFDWRKLHGERQPRRLSLPTYPFAREKYWIETVGQVVASAVPRAIAAAPAQVAPAPLPELPVTGKPRKVALMGLADAGEVAPAIEAPRVALPPVEVPVMAAAAEPEVYLPEDEPAPRIPTLEELRRKLAASLAEALYMEVADVDSEKPFIDLGLDSIVGVEWVKAINKEFGLSIAATRVYDYPNIRELAAFVAKEIAQLPAVAKPVARTAAPRAPAPAMAAPAPAAPTVTLAPVVSAAPLEVPVPAAVALPVRPAPAAREKIAIVGMSGRYPQASHLREYWENLAQGRNSVVEIPRSRWDVNEYFDATPGKRGKVYCKSLGMLDDVDRFDPLFFQISPAEARIMDPQHRLFMEEAYRAFEDAGYSNRTLSNRKCGVYLGIMSNEYSLLLARDSSTNSEALGTSYAIGAARIAYHLNLKGPAIPIDTACSSSLVGIHLACQALLSGEIDMALAGGVTLYLTPDSYIAMCQLGMLSPDGQCKTFDDSADGFVPGEGVGALVLKRLSDAEADNDVIHGVIIGSGINQDGKTNGITAPSVSSQIELERDVYARHAIDSDTISYVETHGTGTKLGDPIELEALATVFGEKTSRRNFCALGSVKTNIGHTSGAAGVASVHKVLMSMRHRTLAPSLNIRTENSLFDFKRSPFYICREKQDWKVPEGSPRRAAVSSFGFSGTNAHLVLEEYTARRIPAAQRPGSSGPSAIVLSARTQAQLKQKARDLLDYLQQPDVQLESIAYTLQVGREAFRERFAVMVDSVDELVAILRGYVDGAVADKVHVGQAARDVDGLANVDDANVPDANLLEQWIKGFEVDWERLYAKRDKPRRLCLPTYPFAGERYWPDTQALPVPVSTPEIKPAAQPAGRQRLSYYPRWKASPLRRAAALPASGSILVLDTSDELFLALKTQLAGASKAVPILVRVGESFRQVAPDVFTINAGREDDCHRLVDALKSAHWLPLHVLHHCTTDAGDTEAAQLDHGIYTIFHLCKALMAHKCPTRFLSVFRSDPVGTAPHNAALAGFLKSLTLENPRYLAKVIDIRAASGAAETARLALAEFLDEQWSPAEVRYQTRDAGPDLVRHVRELARYEPKTGQAELPLKQRGVYIVTGGLGGLGFIFCEYLVRNFAARLVLLGRSALSPAQEAKLQQLKAVQPETTYCQADVARAEDVERAVATAKSRFTEINGVIHAAGVNRDSFIIRKTREEMDAVLAPKVWGAIHLDRATRAENLDLFVMFSSVAGALGNPGQSDYAYGNHFLDSFAEHRESLRSLKERSGRTLSINWPFWTEGGMKQSAGDVARTEAESGLRPLPTAEGIQYWEEFLRSDLSQGVALYGDAARIDSYVAHQSVAESAGTSWDEPAAAPHDPGLVTAAENYLKQLVGDEIKLSADLIDSQERFEAFGIDSIVVGRLNASLSRDLGALPKTLFYEYETIEELAQFLARDAAAALAKFLNLQAPQVAAESPPETTVEPARRGEAEPVAIVGVHGDYPGCQDLGQYWEHLREGKDLVGTVPASRWDAEALADRIYCKSGAFLEDFDKFDAPFFNIPAEEARLIDPQERLFLMSVWSAVEDAGYSRDSLKKLFPKAKSADVGVFVGITTNSSASSLPWSLANRVSYFFDFRGPSMPVDTACSSSLVAIHQACESLHRGECQVAIAGAVNLYLTPEKYQSFCQRRMLATEGKCRSYGAGDDGFVPGEGVGSLVLKPLSKAIEHRDHIYAVIRSSAFEHGGRSNGYSAPNPNSQAQLIDHTLRKADIHPETIGYIEGHGTGTQLGDSLEIAALTQAFRRQTEKVGFCPVGSVKANLGHAESAAGIAGITKILLQMKHRKLLPTIHSDVVNPGIEFADSPFFLQHGLATWDAPEGHPRRALINSFGAGGVNACVVLEEYGNLAPAPQAGPQLVVLSARNEERLFEYANRLLQHVETAEAVDMAALAYTLQTGREAMTERLAFVAADTQELCVKLREFGRGATPGVHRGSLEVRRPAGKSGKAREALAARDLDGLAQAWTAGEDVEWEKLHANALPRRVSLPVYPFARDSYPLSSSAAPAKASVVRENAPLHPLVSHNSSTLREVSFSSWLSADAFYARDHKVNGQMIFPGAGFLEIACVSASIAGTANVARLEDVVWVQPLVFGEEPRIIQTSLEPAHGKAGYVISSYGEDGEKVVHCEGEIHYDDAASGAAGKFAADEYLSIDALRQACSKRLEGAPFYDLFETSGISYGPAFRTMQELHVGENFALARIAIADHLRAGFDDFTLHPCIVDGALQTVSALIGGADTSVPYLPFAIEEVEIRRHTAPACFVYVEPAGSRQQGNTEVLKFNVKIANERGLVLVNFRSFSVRSFRFMPQDQLERKS
ncbi:MAG TPA: SDR family NAD(P)-dependent oxidoreductase [Steroidobacteraceae bacterium]|nr:SDR family NAD(P)-dependent oxidoreductase [Steroidobacteraceae bacterium]